MLTKGLGRTVLAASVISAIPKWASTRARLLCVGAFALCAMLPGLAAPAHAETLTISATGLVMRCPCMGGTTDIAEEQRGVFKGETPSGRYFVPVVFPVTTGQSVCSFSMVYQDVNQNDTMTARLYHKAYTPGGNPFAAPTAIATVKSAAGVSSAVRVATTTTIQMPVISSVRTFYYIEVDIPTTNLNLLGFEIAYKPNC